MCRKQNHSRLQLRLNIRQIKGAGQVVEPQNCHQHQNGAEHGVQNEFHRGINSPAVSPNSNQEVHRNQRKFPEEEKEQQIERNENANHGRLNHQQGNEESFYVLLNGLPRAQNRQRRQKCSEQNQKQADAIRAQVIMNVCSRDPVVIFLELISGINRIESAQQK